MATLRNGHPYIIAEVAQAHDGSLGNAMALLDACADAGASAIKFQCHDGDDNNEFPIGRPNTYNFPQDASRRLYWDRTGFSAAGWQGLRKFAWSRSVDFGITPFSRYAIDEFCRLEVDFFKVARGTWDLLPHIPAGRSVIATTPHKRKHPPEDVHLIGLDENLYDGISCHSGTVEQPIAAINAGASIVEVHVCWHRKQFGPDTCYSITIDQLAGVCDAGRRYSR